MSTPDKVLTTIGNTLLKVGCINNFQLRDETTHSKGNGESRTDRTLHVTLNNANKARLVIRSHHDRAKRVLILTGDICPEIQVDLVDPCRGCEVNKKPAIAVGTAVNYFLEHFRRYLGCKPI